jgi:hypothetical protein
LLIRRIPDQCEAGRCRTFRRRAGDLFKLSEHQLLKLTVPDWVKFSGIKLDERGFVLTGDEAGADRLPLETSRRGIFAFGQARGGFRRRRCAGGRLDSQISGDG